MRIDVTAPNLERAIAELEKLATGKQFDLALMRALNKTGAWANTQLKRAVSRELGIQQKLILPRFVITKSSTARLVAQVWFGTHRIPLFKAAQGKVSKRAHGVSTPVRGGRAGYVPGGFVAKMKSGRQGVYTRRGRERLPIVEEMLPIETAGDRAFADLVNGELNDKFMSNLDHELRFVLGA